MVSPELLRRYPFFGKLGEAQLVHVAMLAQEVIFESGEVIFTEGDPAEALYFLLEGYIDLYFKLAGQEPTTEPGIPVGEINPGEPFGISALIDPFVLTSTARTPGTARVIKINAVELRSLFKTDRKLAYSLTEQAAQAALKRLHFARVQLAAAWA